MHKLYLCLLSQNQSLLTRRRSYLPKNSASRSKENGRSKEDPVHEEKIDCEKIDEGIISLRNEVDKFCKNTKSSESLDDILNHHRSPFHKRGLSYTVNLHTRRTQAPNLQRF